MPPPPPPPPPPPVDARAPPSDPPPNMSGRRPQNRSDLATPRAGATPRLVVTPRGPGSLNLSGPGGVRGSVGNAPRGVDVLPSLKDKQVVEVEQVALEAHASAPGDAPAGESSSVRFSAAKPSTLASVGNLGRLSKIESADPLEVQARVSTGSVNYIPSTTPRTTSDESSLRPSNPGLNPSRDPSGGDNQIRPSRDASAGQTRLTAVSIDQRSMSFRAASFKPLMQREYRRESRCAGAS